MDEILYTVPEVAKLIKSNADYVYQLIKSGLLPVLKLGKYKVRRTALLDFLAKYEGKDLTDPQDIRELDFKREEGQANEKA
jgi:excisionase family DNA binding protein